MSVGSPLVGVVGAGLPAAPGLLPGDAVSSLDLAGVACGLAAVAAVSWTPSGQGRGELRRVLPLVVAAGIGFAGFYLAIDQAARTGGETWWPRGAARAGSVLGAAIAVARLRPRGRPTGRWPMLIAIGLGALLGNAFFVMANAQGALSVAAVLSSLYPVATIVLARLVLGERLRRAQGLGVGHAPLAGGLRPSTIVELAAEFGYDGLPTTDPTDLAAWVRRGADRKSLELYLETFAHPVGVLPERDAIIRVAAECAEDLAADGVVSAEVLYAPELSTERGLTLDEVVQANLEGFGLGMERAAAAGRPIVMKMIATAMRQAARSVEVAQCAVRHRDEVVVGFDIAGPEAGYRPTRHLDAFDFIRHENFHITIHAGESFGLPSIWEALQWCGAERLGHGVRLVA